MRVVPLLLLVSCASTPVGEATITRAERDRSEPVVTYIVRGDQGDERVLGTLDAAGFLWRDAATPFVRLDGGARPLPPSRTEDVRWSIERDGAIRARVAAPGVAPFEMQLGLRVTDDGRLTHPGLGVAYVLREDGRVVTRHDDGREEVAARWQLKGPGVHDRKRAMVGLLLLDEVLQSL